MSLKANSVTHVDVNAVFGSQGTGYLAVDAVGDFADSLSRTVMPSKTGLALRSVHIVSATYYRAPNGDLIGTSSVV
ncbi:MAG: hypothetical protein IT292_02385 [Deltaproteobacteria bacterium]|nr:hypothetical protein [Deltaproteobacteria bacterium]